MLIQYNTGQGVQTDNKKTSTNTVNMGQAHFINKNSLLIQYEMGQGVGC